MKTAIREVLNTIKKNTPKYVPKKKGEPKPEQDALKPIALPKEDEEEE